MFHEISTKSMEAPTCNIDVIWMNQANPLDTEAPFLDLRLVHYKMYDKRDDFNFEIVLFPFLDGDVPSPPPSYGVYTSQLIRFARVCSHVDDFNNRHIFYFKVTKTRLSIP